MPETTRYIGLDVHKASISVAIAEEGRNGEVRFLVDFLIRPWTSPSWHVD